MSARNCTDWKPTPAQKRVLDAATNVGVKRTITAICEDADISRRTFYVWMNNDPCFVDAWENVWRRAVGKHMPGVVSAMLMKALSGNVQAARLVAQLADVLVEKKDITSGGEPIKGYVNVSPDDWEKDGDD